MLGGDPHDLVGARAGELDSHGPGPGVLRLGRRILLTELEDDAGASTEPRADWAPDLAYAAAQASALTALESGVSNSVDAGGRVTDQRDLTRQFIQLRRYWVNEVAYEPARQRAYHALAESMFLDRRLNAVREDLDRLAAQVEQATARKVEALLVVVGVASWLAIDFAQVWRSPAALVTIIVILGCYAWIRRPTSSQSRTEERTSTNGHVQR